MKKFNDGSNTMTFLALVTLDAFNFEQNASLLFKVMFNKGLEKLLNSGREMTFRMKKSRKKELLSKNYYKDILTPFLG